MKKGLVVGVCFLLILTLFISFASAGFFSDLLKRGITGNPTDEEIMREEFDEGSEGGTVTVPIIYEGACKTVWTVCENTRTYEVIKDTKGGFDEKCDSFCQGISACLGNTISASCEGSAPTSVKYTSGKCTGWVEVYVKHVWSPFGMVPVYDWKLDCECKISSTDGKGYYKEIPTICGNGIREAIEECDNGTSNSDSIADACRTTCQNPWCGDGVIDSGENCSNCELDVGPCSECGDGTCYPENENCHNCLSDCPCSENEECNSNGQCIVKTVPKVSACTETDDGFNPYTRGNMTVEGKNSIRDSCAGANYPTILYEWICDGSIENELIESISEANGAYYAMVYCPTKCENGKCVSECGDSVCEESEKGKCFVDCGYRYETIETCEECVPEFIWCKSTNDCISDPSLCPSTKRVNSLSGCQIPECREGAFNSFEELGLIDSAYQNRVAEIISRKCRRFYFESIDSVNLPLIGKQFNLANRNILEILDITSNVSNANARLDFKVSKSEVVFDTNAEFYTWEDASGWEKLEYNVATPTSTDYLYYVYPEHFSLFLIAEIDYCGNEVFDASYEYCDWSVEGTTNCTEECVCEEDFEADGTGACLEDIDEDACDEEGDEDCVGYTWYLCDEDLTWDNKGKVVGECEVECLLGATSCEGEYPLRCGTDYQWDTLNKTYGLCGYTSVNTLGYETADRCGNGYCNYEEDEITCPEDCARVKLEEPNWFLIGLIMGILVLIAAIIFVLYKIFNKGGRGGGMPMPNRGIPPEHRPGPKREPGRPPVIHHGMMGRPPAGGYPTRRYPQ